MTKDFLYKLLIVAVFLFQSNYCFGAIDLNYIDDLFSQNKLEEVQSYLNKVDLTQLSNQEKSELLLKYAQLKLETSKFAEALEYTNQADKLNPDLQSKIAIKTNIIKAVLHFANMQLPKALEILNDLEYICVKNKHKEQLGDIYSFKGYINAVSGKDTEALSLYYRALQLYTDEQILKKRIDVELNIVGSLNNLAQYDQALALIDTITKENITLNNPKIEARIDIASASIYTAKGNQAKSLEYIDKAINITKRINDEMLLAEASNWKGIIIIGKEQYNEAKELFDTSSKIYTRYFGTEHPLTATSESYLSTIYFKEGKYPQALDLALKANKVFQKSYGTSHPVTANSYNQLAELYNKLGEYDKALKLYYTSMENLELTFGKDHINNAFVYNNIASVFYKQKKYYEALEWYNKALDLTKKYFDEGHSYNSKLYNNIALCLYNLKRFDEALEYLNKSLSIIIKQSGENSLQVATAYSNLAAIYEQQYKYEQAIDLYIKAVNIIEDNNLSEHPISAIIYGQLANMFNMLEMYDKALEYYQKVLTVRQNMYSKNHPDLALAYNHIGNVFENKKDYNQAFLFYKKAISLLKKTANEEYYGIFYCNMGYLKQKQAEYDQAIKYYDIALNHFGNIMNYTSIKKDKFNFSGNNVLIYDNAIKSSVMLKRFDKALFYSDKSRYQDLISSLAYQKVILSDIITKNDLNTLEDLEGKLQQAQKLCMGITVDSNNLVANQENVLTENNDVSCQEEKTFRTKLNDFIKYLDKKYPEFYKKRYSGGSTLNQLNKIVQKPELRNSAIIEYFVGFNNLYVFVIFNGKVTVIKEDYSQEALEKLVTNYTKTFRLLSLANSSDLMINILKKYDLKGSYNLYKILLEPAINQLKTYNGFNENTNLIIVPHEILYYLPFESLITKEIAGLKEKNDTALSEYEDLPYVLKDYNISYLPSLSILEFIKPYKNLYSDKKENLLIVGNPDITYTKENKPSLKKLGDLPYSEKEARLIKDILGTQAELIVGPMATEKTISSQIGQYNNYHFACHGILNDVEPLYSGIALSREPFISKDDLKSGYDGVLYAYELLNKKIKANLVVLSACDSGLGKIVSGEGILGLTRAFLVSGTNSIIISLWKINDESSSLIMKEFYTQLNKDSSIKAYEALKNAKLALIKTDNPNFSTGKYKGLSFSHPYFWAPFIYSGY